MLYAVKRDQISAKLTVCIKTYKNFRSRRVNATALAVKGVKYGVKIL